jgi:hypothetical protein
MSMSGRDRSTETYLCHIGFLQFRGDWIKWQRLRLIMIRLSKYFEGTPRKIGSGCNVDGAEEESTFHSPMSTLSPESPHTLDYGVSATHNRQNDQLA